MTLIFETPSRRCPHRHHNGARVTIEDGDTFRHHVRRIGRRYTQVFSVRFPNGLVGLAFEDELHIEPSHDCQVDSSTVFQGAEVAGRICHTCEQITPKLADSSQG